MVEVEVTCSERKWLLVIVLLVGLADFRDRANMSECGVLGDCATIGKLCRVLFNWH